MKTLTCSPSMFRKKRWEYRVEQNPTIEEMNELGQDGWEAIVTIWHEMIGRKYNPIVYFKRKAKKAKKEK